MGEVRSKARFFFNNIEYTGFVEDTPGANGQGKTKDEARDNLAEAIALILEERREDGMRGVPPDVTRETVTIS